MFGIGLVQGLYTTAKRFFMKKVTQRYPEVPPDLAPRSKGSFAFDADACISCCLCSDVCPNGVIKVDYSVGEDKRRRLELYRMNLGYCLFCGLCVEVCPKSAIIFKTDFDLACFRKDDNLFVWKGPLPRPAAAGQAPAAAVAGEATAAAVAADLPSGSSPNAAGGGQAQAAAVAADLPSGSSPNAAGGGS